MTTYRQDRTDAGTRAPEHRRTVVTAGPTLTADEVRRILPAAEVRPPVAADQVLRWGLRPGDRLLIIDGLFLHSRAIRHKELLALIDAGVEVYGASSMGALRAAELAPFGMVGIGSVFRAYRDQEITGDDEVALLHAGPEAGHRALSWALVDLRHAAGHALRTGVIGRDCSALIVDTAARMPFTARDSATVLAAARAHGADPDELDAFRTGYTRGGPRIKRRDAVTALRRLALTTERPPAAEGPARGRLTYLGAPVPLAETVFLRSWRSTPLPEGPRTPEATAVGGEQVLEALALTWDGFADALRDIAAAEILATLPAAHGVPPLTARAGWPALSAALSERSAELGLPADRAAARSYAELLRPDERELPWQQAGPLLATRLWRTTSRLDWATPAIAALRDHPAFAATAAALIRCGEESDPDDPADAADSGNSADSADSAAEQQRTRAQCARILAAWQVTGPAELMPALRAHGFLGLPDFVRTVRAHLPFQSTAEPVPEAAGTPVAAAPRNTV
ncbi:TfuA-like protein [Streptomyces sp. NPDC056492]|uniref:TfuA-like protein n=1 Tax=unclassified Streptomyces TaxID=2593676 RepID=UPI0036BA48EE